MASRHRYQEFLYVGSPSNSVQYFVVPAGVSCVHVTMVGGGGGGGSARVASSQLAFGAGGGGGGEFCVRAPYHVTPGDSVPVIVGDPGFGAIRVTGGSAGTAGQDGGASLFGNLRCAGGFGAAGSGGGSTSGGNGGGPGAGVGTTNNGAAGSVETKRGFHGGASGGGYLYNVGASSRSGGPCAGVAGTPGGVAGRDISPSSVNPGGGGGASSLWGQGGQGGDCGNHPIDDANGDDAPETSYGAGGGGAGADFAPTLPLSYWDGKGFGGDGAPGYVRVDWIEDDSQGSPG